MFLKKYYINKIINTKIKLVYMLYQFTIFDPKQLIGGFNSFAIKIAFAVLTFLVGFIIGKLIERVVYKVLSEIELNKTIKNIAGFRINADHLISQILAYTIYFLALVAALEQLGLANTVLYLISGAIILIILFSIFLTLRDFIPNFTAGLFLYRKEQFKKGTIVEIGDIKGEIKHMDLFQLKIQTKKGDVLFIPNSMVIKSKIKVKK